MKFPLARRCRRRREETARDYEDGDEPGVSHGGDSAADASRPQGSIWHLWLSARAGDLRELRRTVPAIVRSSRT